MSGLTPEIRPCRCSAAHVSPNFADKSLASASANVRGVSPRDVTKGFTLVELLVVIAIIGVLAALLLPAVQAARESSRQSSCQNNLKNIGVALANFHAARGAFPIGNDVAWSARILPFLEAGAIARQIDFNKAWDTPGANQNAANQNLPVYVCPSSLNVVQGKQDYGGIFGTAVLPLSIGAGPTDAFGCGTLIVSNSAQPNGINAAQITDGLSHTLCVGESADRADASAGGLWANGANCFSQNQPFVNMDDLDSLHSSHPVGAFGLFTDGHARLIHDQTDTFVLGAICTRNGNESDVDSSLVE
jgi:prepilin-type N-terminal cleavage/methylation domain-containing protein